VCTWAGGGGKCGRILNLGTAWRWVGLTFAIRPFCARGKKEASETRECEVLCVPGAFWTLSKRERILPLPGIEPHLLGRSSHTLVHVPTAVFSSHLHFPHKKGTWVMALQIKIRFNLTNLPTLAQKHCTYWLFKELLLSSNCRYIYPFLALTMQSKL